MNHTLFPDHANSTQITAFLKTLSVAELKSQRDANFEAYHNNYRTADKVMRFDRLVSDECFRRIDEAKVHITRIVRLLEELEEVSKDAP